MDKLAQFCNGFSCASIELWMHLRDLMRIQEAYVQSNVASNKSEACSSFSFRQPRSRPPLTRWKRGNDVIVSNLRSETIACEASVSVLFRSKGRAKNGASKPLSFFASRFISRAAKTENLVPRSFFAPKQHGNACYAN